MTTVRAIVVAVLLVYVLVLNSFIVSVLYQRHARRVIVWADGPSHEPFNLPTDDGVALLPKHNATTWKLARPEPECSDEVAVAVLTRVQSTTRSSAGTLARLRGATSGAGVLVLLVVTPETISPLHHT